ncbi:hypothetical protein DUNSADRAFT_16631 [Dunaliella salina]|uniref:Uncharacterized protein n=1 Tax=Dunaliella salina TaxID=3046 RepID=A0ABQ7G379_DUNSA|nr:hypothetical protein DUNSADRAFT_16631 [Dunaliella salina]|eukprot:KAF5829060.1 hypothetical protein DUNSADRAFT_16631 [Dunaliella salina]
MVGRCLLGVVCFLGPIVREEISHPSFNTADRFAWRMQLLATNATSEYESSEQRAQQYNQEEVQVHEVMLDMAVSERQQMQLLLTEVNEALGLALEAKEAAQMEAAAQKAALEEERSNRCVL